MLPALSKNQSKLVRSLHQKKYRDREGLFWIEGQRLCKDALNTGVHIEYGIIDRDADLETQSIWVEYFQQRHIPLYTTKFKDIADTTTPQGIGCVLPLLARRPDPKNAKRLVLIDGLQDPGNLGTIIRTAEWFGYDGLVTGTNTVDIYNPKVVRSSMGAIFHLAFFENVSLIEYITELKSHAFKITGSELKLAANTPDNTVAKLALLIGSEAFGLAPELYATLDYNLLIPGAGKSESLNAAVAAGILMHALTIGQ